MTPFVIGIAGGSGAGKTTIAQQIIDQIGDHAIAWLPYDAYYCDLGHLTLAERQAENFDHPDAFDTELFLSHLDQLIAGHAITLPNYDFVQYTRVGGGQIVQPRPIIMLDGILLFVAAAVRARMQLRIFIEVADDIRLLRRILRDTQERGRDVTSVCQQYLATVRPMHHAFVKPSRNYADLIIPGVNDVTPAVNLITNHIRQLLSTTPNGKEGT
jgi:uridine kinase